jgi:hypothetical protein
MGITYVSIEIAYLVSTKVDVVFQLTGSLM